MFGPPSLGKSTCGTKKTTTTAATGSSETTLKPRPRSLLFQRMSHNEAEATPTTKPAEPEPAGTSQDEDGPEPGKYPGHKDQDRPNTAEKKFFGLVDYTSVFSSLKEEDEADEEDYYAYAEEDAEPEVKHGFVKLTKRNPMNNGGDPVSNGRAKQKKTERAGQMVCKG